MAPCHGKTHDSKYISYRSPMKEAVHQGVFSSTFHYIAYNGVALDDNIPEPTWQEHSE